MLFQSVWLLALFSRFSSKEKGEKVESGAIERVLQVSSRRGEKLVNCDAANEQILCRIALERATAATARDLKAQTPVTAT